jgi:hypothetical protein
LHPTSSAELLSWIGRTLAMAGRTGEYRKFREEFYRSNLGDIVSDSRETVPCVLALFYLAHGDPNAAIVYGANFGRDADTIGTMVGALAGAFKGAGDLKREWVDKLEATYGKKQEISKDYGIAAVDAPNQVQLAEGLVKVIKERITEKRQLLVTCEKLLSL